MIGSFLLASAALLAPASAACQSVPDLTSEQWREDLRVMADAMEATHRNLYHTVSADVFDQAVRALHDRIPELDDHEVIVELARIVSMVGDGHTHLTLGPNERNGFRLYPVRFFMFEEGLFIQVAEEGSPLLGGRVLQIGALSVEEALERVRPLAQRDNELQATTIATMYLAVPEVLHAVGAITDMERATIVVESRNEQRRTETLSPGPNRMAFRAWAVEPSARFSDLGLAIARPGGPSEVPLYLRETRRINSITYVPETQMLYAQVNAIADGNDESLAEFAARLYAMADERRPARLVIDLRQNGGGNNTLNLPLVHGLIERPWLNQEDKAFVLIGRHTFSAASHLVTLLEIHTNATFVGEPTGASPNHYGDTRMFALPHSGLQVRASMLYWQNGDPRDRRPWTAPDLAAPPTFADYVANRDPAMEVVLSYGSYLPLAPQLAEALNRGDNSDRMAAIIRSFSADPRNAYLDATAAVNGLGYSLLSRNQLADALTIFRLNVAVHPDYANGYDSLGEALAIAGQTEDAIAAYERALALSPDGFLGDNARQQIARLREGTSN